MIASRGRAGKCEWLEMVYAKRIGLPLRQLSLE
jgi:hypothetical protein